MKNDLPISPNKKFKYSITFESWDDESLEIGQTDVRGYIEQDETDTIGNILYEANTTYGIYMPFAFGRWESTYPDEDADYFEKGIRKFYFLEITNEDGTQISNDESDFITFLLTDGRYKLDKFRDFAVGGIVLGSIVLGVGALITYFYFKDKKPTENKVEKLTKKGDVKSSSGRAKSVTHNINGVDRKFPIKDAWRKEHKLENKQQKFEVPQGDRQPVKYEMGGDASEHYHEVEYGEGGVARAKDVIMNKIGFNESSADYLVSQSEKFAIWLADSILKKEMQLSYGGTYEDKDNTFGGGYIKVDNDKIAKKGIIEWQKNQPNWIRSRYSNEIRQILDWLQHPVTEKQDLRNLSFDEALEKAREWHNELQVLGGDIDFTEPETNTIIKKYPKNSDGIEYYWVFIPSNYCDLESSRMGHCGRTGYGNNLISLRSVKPYGKGHTISDSHVTIAYGVGDGVFYQIKGKKNNKPAEKYFPYIFDLIKIAISDSINYLKGTTKFDENNKLTKEERVLEFNGFGSEYGDSEDYGFEDMTNEELRELYELKPSIFNDTESILAIYDAGIITDEEIQKEYDVNSPNSIFSSFGNQVKLYERGIILNRPSTIFEVQKNCEDVKDLLRLDSDLSDEVVENVLCGDTYELVDGFSYYYDNPSDLVNNLNKENTEEVINEIVRLTDLDKSVVTENGIKYYLQGEDEEFDTDTFDNIIRALANAQNDADNNDYSTYLYDNLKSALEELGTVHSLNDEGVKMTIDLSNLMSDDEISDNMERYEFEDVSDLFSELLAENSVDLPSYNIDSRYSPYGSNEDFNDNFDIDNYSKGGTLRPKTINSNKNTKIKNMKPNLKKMEKGGDLGVSKEDYFIVVKNWVYFTFNYPMGFVKDVFDSEHLQGKFLSAYDKYGSMGVLPIFWANLDGNNRRILSLWVKNNYFNEIGSKSKLQSISDDDYVAIINHWNMFCLNFPYRFVSQVFLGNTSHYEQKWSRANERGGSAGAVNVFFSELDGGNQRLLTDFASDINKFADGGEAGEKSTKNIRKKRPKTRQPKMVRQYFEDEAYAYADGGRVTSRSGIIEAFLTSNKQLTVGNLSTHFNEYDNQMLLRNYGTLIATRKGNDVEITDAKYSQTTSRITNELNSMAMKKGMNVTYVSKFEEGGEAGKTIRDNYDTLVGRIGDEYYFLDEIFKYNDGFKGATGTVVMPVSKEYYEYATSEDGILERYMDAMGEDEWISTLGLDREDFEDEDDLTKAIENGIWQLYYVGELNPFEEVDSDLEEQMRALPQFASSEEFPIFEIIGGGRIFDKEREFDEIYNQELFDKIKEIEEFAKGGQAGKKTLKNKIKKKDPKIVRQYFEDRPYSYAKGGSADLQYSDILNVLKTKIEDSIDEMPIDYENASNFTGEEVEHESRSGFIPYTDGGYQAVWFEYIGGLVGAGRNLPTKPLDDEMERQNNYNIELAKDWFVDEYPEIVEELGVENIDYRSLYEAGYGEQAEELSEQEMQYDGEDTIMMQVSAYYYSPENSKGVEGKHTIRLFGDVNLESPYHRAGNLDDTYEVEFSFNSISELEQKMDEGIKKIISWFNGDMYNESTTEMKVRRMEEGGEADDEDEDEDEDDDYAKGGSVKGIKKKAEKLLEESINYRWVNTDMGSGWEYKLESPLNRSVFNVLEEHTYLDEFSPYDEVIEDYDDLSKEEQDYYYEDWKETLFQNTFEAFKEKCAKHLDDFIEYIQQEKEYQDEINEYEKGGKANENTKEIDIDFMQKRYFVNYHIDNKKNIEITSVSSAGEDLDYEKFGDSLKKIILEEIISKNDDDEYAKGGKLSEKSTKKPIRKKPQPRMVRQYFEDKPYSYAKGGGVNSNYGKYGDDNSNLVNFDIDNLDDFETTQYQNFSKSMSKAEALQVLINSIEGDYSQLSEQLRGIAEEQMPMDEYAKGGETSKGLTKDEILSKYKGKYIDLLVGEDGKHIVKGVSNTPKSRYLLVEEWYEDLYAEGGKAGGVKYFYVKGRNEDAPQKLKDTYGEFYTENDLIQYLNKWGNIESVSFNEVVKVYENGNTENVTDYYLNKYAEGGEIQDWMEEALQSLIEETGNENLDITMVSDNGNEFFASNDMEEYRVFKSEDDAEEIAVEQVRDDMEESPENFNKDFIAGYIDGRDFFEQSLNEMNRSYADDIASESDRKYGNRLIAEMVDNGLIDEDDAESDNADELAEEHIENFVTLMTEGQLNEGGNGLDYFISNFGEEETMKMVIDNNLIDIDKASRDAVQTDGIGHFLSSYDGETLYLSDDYVAYRIN